MENSTPGGSYTPPPPPPMGGSPVPPAGGGEKLVYPTQPPANPILVLVLNLILGGVGYIIMGQKTKGIVGIAAWLVIGVVTCGVGFSIGILTAIDGYMQAMQLQAGHPVGEWTFFNDHR
jgi:hypothetical protein